MQDGPAATLLLPGRCLIMPRVRDPRPNGGQSPLARRAPTWPAYAAAGCSAQLPKASLVRNYPVISSIGGFCEPPTRLAPVPSEDSVNADLRGASLGVHTGGRINMMRADLRGADLSQTERLEYVYYWDDAIYDETTRWPEDFDPKALTCRGARSQRPLASSPTVLSALAAPSSRGSSQRRHQQL